LRWADDLEGDVEAWLPAINVHIPGSGITPFNIWDLDFWWYRIYRARTKEITDELLAQSKEAGRNRGK
jgi:hypothetical protein